MYSNLTVSQDCDYAPAPDVNLPSADWISTYHRGCGDPGSLHNIFKFNPLSVISLDAHAPNLLDLNAGAPANVQVSQLLHLLPPALVKPFTKVLSDFDRFLNSEPAEKLNRTRICTLVPLRHPSGRYTLYLSSINLVSNPDKTNIRGYSQEVSVEALFRHNGDRPPYCIIALLVDEVPQITLTYNGFEHTFERHNLLTRNETRLLRMMYAGVNRTRILELMAIKPLTLDTHKKNINQKLGTHDTHHAAHIANMLGLLSDGAMEQAFQHDRKRTVVYHPAHGG